MNKNELAYNLAYLNLAQSLFLNRLFYKLTVDIYTTTLVNWQYSYVKKTNIGTEIYIYIVNCVITLWLIDCSSLLINIHYFT